MNSLACSCCFWLYDNAAAADVLSADAEAPAATAADQEQQIPLAAASSPESYIDRNFKKVKKVTAAHPPPPPAAVITTTTTTNQEADSAAAAALNLLTAAPRTSAKTKLTDVEEDTSVETKVLPCSVNNINNNNNEYINVFPNHNHENCEVPKNQFNDDEPNSNQANKVVDPAKPKTEEEPVETKQR